jgi:hypothetical protein
MGDGANLGIMAGRALGTILGGKDQPDDDEKATPEQVRERVMAAPNPCEGEPIWERGIGDESYSVAADCIAKAFLLMESEDPGVLHRRVYWSKDNTGIADLWGKETDAMTAVWDATTAKWPGFDKWIGGASGFMVGFAYNTARYVIGEPPAGNPALLTIDIPEPEDSQSRGDA